MASREWAAIRGHWLKKARLASGSLPCHDPACDFVSPTTARPGLILCHLCHLPIDTNLYKHPDPRSMEVDHVVPRAHGGRDLVSNTLPAHRECNGRKNDDPFQIGALKTSRAW